LQFAIYLTSRNLFAASAQRRLEPACLSEKAVYDFFSIG
jgi:hypothetical protein